jgi:putative ABC transport system substrate-binding protein
MIDRRLAMQLVGAAAFGGHALAQTQNRKVVGYLSPRSPETDRVLAPFHRGMKAAGLIDGSNVRIVHRFAEGRFDRVDSLAAELLAEGPAAVVTSGGPFQVRAIRSRNSAVPIVFSSGSDPVQDGLVESFSRPGGNITGAHVFTTAFGPKRLELLREIAPQARRIGFLINSSNVLAQMQVEQMKGAVGGADVELLFVSASTPREIDAAFETLAARAAQALLMSADTFFQVRRDQIVALAGRHRLPAMFEWPEFVKAGGLASYSPSTDDALAQIGLYVARILDGARAGDLPIYQSTRFELVINLATAKELGISLAPSLLARADEVIE